MAEVLARRSFHYLATRGITPQASAMPFFDRLRAAWGCEQCRFYRRLMLVLATLALVTWVLT
jgi:hypothetical protein